MTIKRALLSVSDKTGIEDFARALSAMGVQILSTGGTASALKKAGIDVTDVSDVTGFPEIMDGRVKTLHPKVHGGILARRDDNTHVKAMKDHGIEGIDMVVINLYPFAQTVRKNADFATCIENIDIGGPAMVRASAKNHDHVAIVTDPTDYEIVLAEMKANKGSVTPALRKKLAGKAFALTASYDSHISNWLAADETPKHISFAGTLKQSLRYGENPHQGAALYLTDDIIRPGAASAVQIQGKELSYNNLNDTDAAFELVSEFDKPAVAIIKHANPCGVAESDNVADAYAKALICDPISAFGGIIALNRPLDLATAQLIAKKFVEVIIAPTINKDAANFLKSKDKVRVLETNAMPARDQKRFEVKRIAGGLLVQDSDIKTLSKNDLKIVTQRQPTPQEIDDLLFAFKVAKHVKSNAIVYAKDGTTVGIGAGQMNRLDSSRIAALKAREAAEMAGLPQSLAIGSVVASDAFFPFADGLIAAAEAGVTAIIQPGGSIKDEEVIAAANERNLAMVFTGIRHFKH